MDDIIMLQETQELQRKQSWYQQNQVSMTKEDEEDYLNFCSEAMFRIHILEQRLNRFSIILSTTLYWLQNMRCYLFKYIVDSKKQTGFWY